MQKEYDEELEDDKKAEKEREKEWPMAFFVTENGKLKVRTNIQA